MPVWVSSDVRLVRVWLGRRGLATAFRFEAAATLTKKSSPRTCMRKPSGDVVAGSISVSPLFRVNGRTALCHLVCVNRWHKPALSSPRPRPRPRAGVGAGTGPSTETAACMLPSSSSLLSVCTAVVLRLRLSCTDNSSSFIS